MGLLFPLFHFLEFWERVYKHRRRVHVDDITSTPSNYKRTTKEQKALFSHLHTVNKSAMTSFIDFFSISVGTLVNNKQVLIEVGETEQISDVLVKLNQHGISSVPLYRKKDSNSKEEYSCHGKEYIGIVSTCDIVSFILQNAKLSSTQAVNADMISMQMAMPIKNVLGETLESSLNLAFTVVAPSTPLTHVVDEMFQGTNNFIL